MTLPNKCAIKLLQVVGLQEGMTKSLNSALIADRANITDLVSRQCFHPFIPVLQIFFVRLKRSDPWKFRIIKYMHANLCIKWEELGGSFCKPLEILKKLSYSQFEYSQFSMLDYLYRHYISLQHLALNYRIFVVFISMSEEYVQ